MKTDLLLIPMSARYRDMRAAAIAAEEAGFDGLWTWDHLRDPDGAASSRVPEAGTGLTALAAGPKQGRGGGLVVNVSAPHPGLLANMAATLQEVSGGRLLLGLGAGAHRRMSYAVEHESLGIPVAPDRIRAGRGAHDALGVPVAPDGIRAERVAEAAQVMKRLWAGDASSFHGDHYRLER